MSLLERARALAATLPPHRAAHDASKELDPAVIRALREDGFLSCLVPKEIGGAELEPSDYVEMLEALAHGDSATAWCVMTASTSSLLTAYLPRDVATSMWSSGSPFLAGVFAPSGKLTDGKLSGRWSYMSGSKHADWLAVGAIADKRHVVCFLPASSVRIVDNWDTLGLAGTGSHDVVIENARIAHEYVTSVFDVAPWSEAPLYRVPLFGLLAMGIAACALGIAQSALDHAAAKLVTEAPPALLVRYGSLRAKLDASRAYLLVTAEKASSRARSGAIDPRTRGEMRLAASYVAEQCAEVVRAAFHVGGGSSARSPNPIGSALCDIETLLTHRMVTDRVVSAAARAILGIGAAPPDL
jgi:alkylation response protein AidB-like acyl-CoA dehydrogenase